MRWVATFLVSILLGVPIGAPSVPGNSSDYVNPVIDSDFPDPAVLRVPGGYFYAYGTQGNFGGRMLNIQVARSRDLVRWERVGDALPVKPAWASHTQDFWAPHVVLHDGRYYLYYSARPDTSTADPAGVLCLAVATATRPEGPFTDAGRPLQCGPGFANIDPMAFDDPQTGQRLLYWGSGFGPIRVRELGADRISFAPDSRPIDLVQPDPAGGPGNYQRLVEGAWVVQRRGWYYLFYSGDNCCGPDAHYAVMVARSRHATGPYQRMRAAGSTGGVILSRRGRWVAPGHNSVIADANGALWMVYHAVDSRNPRSSPGDEVNTRRAMLLDRIGWRNGWPYIAGGGPSDDTQPAPAIR
jgi:arabinan endo-1,5-alpha-L-arabinosidase